LLEIRARVQNACGCPSEAAFTLEAAEALRVRGNLPRSAEEQDRLENLRESLRASLPRGQQQAIGARIAGLSSDALTTAILSEEKESVSDS
jgi:hypothetical protein